MEAYLGFSILSDRESFFVLSPNGMGLFGYLQHWNAGHCCGKAAKDQIDGRIHVTSWQDCAEGSAVSLYLVEGRGHDWPGKYFAGKLPQSNPLRNFDAAKIIWEFF